MFLPRVFTFLIFSLPVLVFVTLAFRLIFRIHRQNLEKAKGERRNCGVCAQRPTFVEDDIVVDKEKNSSIQPQSVRRRNVKEKDNQVFVQEGVEEKDMFFSTISNDALVDKAALEEENPKEIREVMVDSVVHRTESSEDGEDEGEEEAQEDGNKFVEWTEDDRKNLMDLGISEMERNTRLDSLIARRRARKLLSMQVRSTLMNASSNDPCSHIASILIPRSNPFPSNDSGGAQISPAPGSAPSVLLPMHNPFDIPYDPQEEKPNLTGGGFEEEFIAAHQKDIMFCRHESFSLGAFFPGPGEFDQSRREAFYCPNFSTRQRSSEIPEYSRFRNQSGNEKTDKRIQTESSEECKPMVHINNPDDHGRQEGQGPEHIFDLVDTHHEEDRSEVHIEENIVRDVTGGSSSSSSSEMSVPFSAANRDQILKSLSFSVLRNIGVDREYDAQRNEVSDGSPPTFGKRRLNERFFFADKGVNHTPTHSIASDLQVEVSEVGSPELTVDGTISPSDGESLIYEANADVEKETASGSEEMWVASSRLSRVEENESRSREVHEVSEQDIIEVGFSRINHKFEDIVASDMPEKAVEFPESSQTHSTDFDGKVHEVQPPSTYSSEALSTEDLGSLTLENAWQSRERSEPSPSCDGNSEKPEEVNIIYENDQVVITNDDEDILEFIKDTYGEAHTLTKRETPEELSVLTTKSNVKQVTQPAIMTEQGPNDASSSSSSTSVTEKKAPISQASLPIYDQITQTKVQQIGAEVVDDNFLDRRLPESSNLTVSHDTLHLTEDSATYLCDDRNPGKLQEPSNSFQELNSIDSVKNSEVPANDENLIIIEDTNSEAQELAREENARVLSNMSEESISNLIDVNYIESQSEKMGEDQTMLKTSEDSEGNDLKPLECDNTAETSYPVENNYIVESTRECDHDSAESRASEVGLSTDVPIAPVMLIGAGESGLLGQNQSFTNDSNPPALLPEVVVEPVPFAASSSSSPTSVLQQKFSIDQASVLSFEQDVLMEIQQSETEMEESTTLNELPFENSTGAVLQDALHVTEDPQEPSSYPVKSTEEGSVNDMNDSASSEKEEKLNSESVEDGEGQPKLLTKQEARIDPMDLSNVEGRSDGLEQMTDNGESMISKDIGDRSMPTNTKENLKATEVEGESKYLNANEANVVALAKPVEQNDDSNIPATSEERELTWC
ncbi:Guanine nucleotide-exchange factor like [Actinidia chinensis var. chinensis]|uniref:Guanine nucleotide-exchange factor like n=1 Tax=Actinidia chinensis var. chinensis TaxID=1590841 RepID=A0A2R6QJE1_ACTCC|nr:Guanine nucleotide-exchange factor like [Actinidia chinensis var. chinensis]